MRKKRLLSGCAAILSAVSLLAGCAGASMSEPEAVELMEPVGVKLNYESVIRRNLFNAKVVSGIVCPEVQEYAPVTSMRFEEFTAFPGSRVAKGDTLLHGSTEDIDKQIENMEKSLKSEAESYLEFMEENNKSLAEAKEQQRRCEEIMKNLDEDPDHTEIWQYQYTKYSGELSNSAQNVMELEQSIKKRTELYELDRAHALAQLEYLKKDKKLLTVTAKRDGVVAGLGYVEDWGYIRGFRSGDWISPRSNVIALADTSVKDIKCEFVNKSIINDAQEDIYAIIGGKRYEIEYVPMDQDEYKRLKEENREVFSTFHITGNPEEIEMGAYVLIVLVNQAKRDVLTVSSDAVKKDDTAQYVYVLQDGESVYTPVKTGMRSGAFVEITSGLNEGDKVITESALTGGTETAVVKKGSMVHEFTADGHLDYASTEVISNPIKYGTSYFLEYCVKQYQPVKKGDVVAKIRVARDEIGLERQTRSLSKEQKRLAELREKLAKAQAEDEKKNLGKQVKAEEEVVAQIEKTIGEMQADFKTTEIKSPTDGIVIYLQSYEEESLLYSGAYLVEVAHEELSYIRVDDDAAQITFGNKANISFNGSDGEVHTAVGEVVTLNKYALGKKLVSGSALIRVSAEDIANAAMERYVIYDERYGTFSRLKYDVTIPIRTMHDILIVPRSAVKEINGGTYVKLKSESGEYYYQGFISGGVDKDSYWVVDGLTEGMEICLE